VYGVGRSLPISNHSSDLASPITNQARCTINDHRSLACEVGQWKGCLACLWLDRKPAKTWRPETCQNSSTSDLTRASIPRRLAFYRHTPERQQNRVAIITITLALAHTTPRYRAIPVTSWTPYTGKTSHFQPANLNQR
jgi:hypothetical protein